MMNELKPRSAEQATCSANAELTEADVRKALEICVNCACCNECPYFKKENCATKLHQDALALLRENKATLEMCAEVIQRQDKELARKDALLEQWDAKCNDYEIALMGKDAEIERLKKHLDYKCIYGYDGDVMEYCVQGPCPHYKTESEIRADTIEELVERVKEAVKYIPWCDYPPVHNCIDQIAKEMKEESATHGE